MRAALLSCIFLVSGCLSDQLMKPGGDGTGTGGGNGTGTGGGGGAVMDPGCGKQTFPIALNQTPPVVMLVVDDSGSMKELVPGTTTAKWDVLKEAVSALLTKYDGKVDWGLSIFPKPNSGNSCTPGVVEIPAAAGNTQNILGKLAPLTVANIGGNTPTETTLLEIEKNGGLKTPGRNNYVLLMTDGLPTCNQDGRVTSVVTALANAAIRTFVVGLGDGTQSDPDQLNDWATAGKTARAMAATKYYQSNNIMELQASFENILTGIASCTYQLTSKPTDANLIVPYLDGTAVSADPVNGFTYDAASNSITFKGTSCDKVKAGGATKVDVIYGCPSPPII
jgi:hypothetical protein